MRAILNSDGSFSVHVEKGEVLPAPCEEGSCEPRKWVPCSRCGGLVSVELEVDYMVCEECEELVVEADRLFQVGYSEACGYWE